MSLAYQPSGILPGFNDPVHEAQQVFRQLLEAMSHPSVIVDIETTAESPGEMREAMTALALTLFDADTPVWLDAALAERASIADYLRFHCGCPIVQSPVEAAFALIGSVECLPRLERFSMGDVQYPERSATVIMETPQLTGGAAVVLTGPGIETTRDFDAVGLPDWFWSAWAVNHGAFPLGVDTIFTCGDEFCALPRSTLAEA
ncbi:MAG: phosphonate C-P lyase system protein PhnH [Proteobacteria bacterium]|nr:phosphonate C-P lyase system protein PhnH [Pseudomonadota bacterium]